MEDCRPNALFLDMPTKGIRLISIDPDEHAAVARPIIRPGLCLIQDELESLSITAGRMTHCQSLTNR